MESVGILQAIWQQYEHHESRFSETIIKRLVAIARTTKSMGYSSLALSIFQSAMNFSSSTRSEEHSSFRKEIEEQITTTSTEVLREIVTSTTSTSKSSSTLNSIFTSMIIDMTKTVDVTTMQLARNLTVQYIEQQEYKEAISIIGLMLKRPWLSFFPESIEHVSLTSTYTKESIELVGKLAECYLQLREFKKVEDVYVRLFRSVL